MFKPRNVIRFWKGNCIKPELILYRLLERNKILNSSIVETIEFYSTLIRIVKEIFVVSYFMLITRIAETTIMQKT